MITQIDFPSQHCCPSPALAVRQPQRAVSQSLGLRGTSYPGPPTANHFQPQRGCDHSRPSIARDIRHNRVAVDELLNDDPRQALTHQPWAGGRNPFGIGRSAAVAKAQPQHVIPMREKIPRRYGWSTRCDWSCGHSRAPFPIRTGEPRLHAVPESQGDCFTKSRRASRRAGMVEL